MALYRAGSDEQEVTSLLLDGTHNATTREDGG